MISGRTKVFTIIAHPAAHVMAPRIYNRLFERLGLDMVYIAHAVPSAAVGQTMQVYRAWENLGGFNVTIPHKEITVEFLDTLCPITAHTGVVNTVVRQEDGTLLGYNTDGLGALHALGDVKDTRCLVLGAGGASRAIVDALIHGGSTKVYILNRSRLRAEQLIEQAPVDKAALFTEDLLPQMDIVIQATPMSEAIPFDLDLSLLKQDARLLEIVMRDTAFSRQAAQLGLKLIPGFAMLYHQTQRNFKLFTGLDITDDDVRDAFALLGYRP
ncbi:MAG: shikimate dehydrogenase [Syntrophaceae bacterium]